MRRSCHLPYPLSHSRAQDTDYTLQGHQQLSKISIKTPARKTTSQMTEHAQYEAILFQPPIVHIYSTHTTTAVIGIMEKKHLAPRAPHNIYFVSLEFLQQELCPRRTLHANTQLELPLHHPNGRSKDNASHADKQQRGGNPILQCIDAAEDESTLGK